MKKYKKMYYFKISKNIDYNITFKTKIFYTKN